MEVRWCVTHDSEIVAPEDDEDTFWLCYASNYSGDRSDCEVVIATLIFQ